jgi:hypothetical protein
LKKSWKATGRVHGIGGTVARIVATAGKASGGAVKSSAIAVERLKTVGRIPVITAASAKHSEKI